MTRELPQEYVSKTILPLLRGVLSHCLRDRGLSQHHIARLLGVTQPMIYKYLRGSRDEYLKALEEQGITRSALRLMVDIACNKILKNDYSELGIIANTLAFQANYCRENREACERNLCSEKPPVLKIYYTILEKLVSMPIHSLIPQVGSNLAYAPARAESLGDVIGLDGRIIRAAGNRVIVAGTPVFGGSRHTGRVALKYARNWKSDSWAFAVKYNAGIVATLENIPGVAFELESSGNVEPVIYIVSKDPEKLLEAIELLIHRQ